MAKSSDPIHRRLCVITREVILTNPSSGEPDLAEMIKMAMSRAHLAYTTETIWNAMSAVKHSMRQRRSQEETKSIPTSPDTF